MKRFCNKLATKVILYLKLNTDNRAQNTHAGGHQRNLIWLWMESQFMYRFIMIYR